MCQKTDEIENCLQSIATQYKGNKLIENDVIYPKEIVLGIRYDSLWDNKFKIYKQIPVQDIF